MKLENFLTLPTSEIASLVYESDSRTFAFPINGTRRWFLLEQLNAENEDISVDYVKKMIDAHVQQYRLFFEHGVYTFLAPIFGPDLLERGHEYSDMAIRGTEELARSPAFLQLYDEFQVCVRFYGNYKSFLQGTEYAFLLDIFAEIEERTAKYTQHRLFFGVCANDATETIAELSVKFYLEHQRIPQKNELIEAYYGEYVDPLSVFIGFDKFTMFDVPLVATGNEDLYFTVGPSLYMDKLQLREILYDHLFTRRLEETDYSALTSEDLALMHEFYKVNRNMTLGVGERQAHGDYWYPTPSVIIPDGFSNNRKKLLS